MVESKQFLEFERPIVELENELSRARSDVESGNVESAEMVSRLERKLTKARSDVFGSLTAYQRVQLSRHFDRPQTPDYVARLISDFIPLHGDRLFGDDPAVYGGMGKLVGRPVMIVGHHRGRGTQGRIKCNFGMTQPEGNRKAQRLFLLAEQFRLPLLTFVDTQGAYPGMEAEARGQAEAIAKCLEILASLKTPIISTVIGEGGSGGALAFSVCDRLLMLENSTFSVITPEGCASILWGKDESARAAEHAETAAQALKVTAPELLAANLVDQVIEEPPGGAHRDYESAADAVGNAIAEHLNQLVELAPSELLKQRREKYRNFGQQLV